MPLLPRDLSQLAPSPDPSPGRPPHCRACRPRAHATLRPRPPRCAGRRYRSHGGQSRGAGAAGDGAGLEPTAPRISPPLLCARRAASGTRPSSPQIARPGETDTCLPPAPVRPQEGPTSPRTWSSAGRHGRNLTRGCLQTPSRCPVARTGLGPRLPTSVQEAWSRGAPAAISLPAWHWDSTSMGDAGSLDPLDQRRRQEAGSEPGRAGAGPMDPIIHLRGWGDGGAPGPGPRPCPGSLARGAASWQAHGKGSEEKRGPGGAGIGSGLCWGASCRAQAPTPVTV